MSWYFYEVPTVAQRNKVRAWLDRRGVSYEARKGCGGGWVFEIYTSPETVALLDDHRKGVTP
jgi:hypothetical protein